MSTIREEVTPQGEPIPQGQRYSVDHVEDTFTISVSSLHGVALGQIVDHLQTKWEVTFSKHQREKIVGVPQ